MLRRKPTPFVVFIVTILTHFATIVAWPQSQTPSTSIRTVDFKNFSYPWVHPDGWPDHLQWMSLRLKEHVQLINGKWDERDSTDETDGPRFSGLTLEGVEYARLSDDRTDDAIVVLRYDTGGTQNHYWVYIFGSPSGMLELLGIFHTGDRAAYGLYQVFGKGRILNVKLYDPKFQDGDCCSSGYLNYRFRWNGQGFEAVGRPISGRADTNSRRPVSIFGLPIDQP
jgi:hypothetical protein